MLDLLLFVVHRLLTVMASLIQGMGSRVPRLQESQHRGSVVVAHGLQSMDSVVVAYRLICLVACGVLPDQGSNPHLLHWQADSPPWATREVWDL